MNSVLIALLAVPLFAVPPIPKLDKIDSLADDAAFLKGARMPAPSGSTAGQKPIARYKIPSSDAEFINRKVASYPLGPTAAPKPVWFGAVGSAGFKTRYLMLSGDGIDPVFVPLDIPTLIGKMAFFGGLPVDVPGLSRYILGVTNVMSMDLSKIEISLTSKDKSYVAHSGLKASSLMRDIGDTMKPKLGAFDVLGQPVALIYSLDVDPTGKQFTNKGTFLFLREKAGGAFDAWAFAEGDKPFVDGEPEDLTLDSPNLPTVALRVEKRGGELLLFNR